MKTQIGDFSTVEELGAEYKLAQADYHVAEICKDAGIDNRGTFYRMNRDERGLFTGPDRGVRHTFLLYKRGEDGKYIEVWGSEYAIPWLTAEVERVK